jgi:hypothetical protein
VPSGNVTARAERLGHRFVDAAMESSPNRPGFDLGQHLAHAFGPTPHFTRLLDRLARTSARLHPAPGTLSDTAFRAALEAVLPELRRFARNLTRDIEDADDLVQEATMKAWTARDRFQWHQPSRLDLRDLPQSVL